MAVFRNSANVARARAKSQTPGSYEEGFWEGMCASFEAAAGEAQTLASQARAQEDLDAKVIPLTRKPVVVE